MSPRRTPPRRSLALCEALSRNPSVPEEDRAAQDQPAAGSGYVLDRIEDAGPTRSSRHIVISDTRAADGPDEEWLVWRRDASDEEHRGQQVEIAFRYDKPGKQQDDQRQLVPSNRSPLVAFFPTGKETGLGFLIQGPYRTTPSRDNVPGHDEWNRNLVTATSALLTEVLSELRDDGLLTVDVLQALPIDLDGSTQARCSALCSSR